MRHRRIAILGSRGIPARYGGFETFAEELGARLVERGFDVTVFCESDAKHPSPPAKYRGIDLEYVSAPRIGRLSTVFFDLAALWRARKRFDVVYMLGYGASLFCFIPRLFGTEVWINMDGVEWWRSKWSRTGRLYLRAMEAVAMRTPNRVIADAAAIRSHLNARYRRLPQCAVIPYGAEVAMNAPSEELLTEWNVRPREYYSVVCRLEPENNVLEVLEGFVCSTSPYQLLVVGDMAIDSSYVRRLREIRDPRVRLIGTVYDQRRLRALRFHSRAYFHGHSVGGTNPSLLEAMACGNAVVAHDNAFNREVAGDAAMYFTKSADIAVIVATLEADMQRLRTMRANARQRIETIYNWNAVADQYERLLAHG